MLRNVLAAVVLDRGSDIARNKPDLKARLRQLIADGGLPSSLSEWTEQLRLYGNAGAHPELFGPVSLEEAKDIAGLARTLLDVVYVIPATIAARQAQRVKPTQ